MPHEISKTPDGRDSMVYVGRSPWHRLGTRIDPSQSKDLDVVLRTAGLDFEVTKRPRHVLEALGPEDPGPADVSRDGVRYRVKRADQPFAVVRSDTGTELGTVDDVWHPLQNREAFEPLQSALDDGVAFVETGGVLRDGKDVWILVRFDRDHVLRTARAETDRGTDPDRGMKRLEDTLWGEPGGGILPYGLFYNDHSGSRHARVQQTAVRVVCANTLEWSLHRRGGRSKEVPHELNVRRAWAEAVESLFRELANGYQVLADQRQVLKETVLSEEAFSGLVLTWDEMDRVLRILERIMSQTSLSRDELDWEERVAAHSETKRLEVRRLWEEGTGHSGDRSAWEAYNGLVEWLDHSASARASNEWLDNLITGRHALNKVQVFARLGWYARTRSGPGFPKIGTAPHYWKTWLHENPVSVRRGGPINRIASFWPDLGPAAWPTGSRSPGSSVFWKA